MSPFTKSHANLSNNHFFIKSSQMTDGTANAARAMNLKPLAFYM